MNGIDVRPAVKDLVRTLGLRQYRPAHGPKAWHLTQCWITSVDARRYALIVPAGYGPLDFLRLVNWATVHDAVDEGLVILGEPQPTPPYNYGGPKYRWKTIQQGRTIGLA